MTSWIESKITTCAERTFSSRDLMDQIESRSIISIPCPSEDHNSFELSLYPIRLDSSPEYIYIMYFPHSEFPIITEENVGNYCHNCVCAIKVTDNQDPSLTNGINIDLIIGESVELFGSTKIGFISAILAGLSHFDNKVEYTMYMAISIANYLLNLKSICRDADAVINARLHAFAHDLTGFVAVLIALLDMHIVKLPHFCSGYNTSYELSTMVHFTPSEPSFNGDKFNEPTSKVLKRVKDSVLGIINTDEYDAIGSTVFTHFVKTMSKSIKGNISIPKEYYKTSSDSCMEFAGFSISDCGIHPTGGSSARVREMISITGFIDDEIGDQGKNRFDNRYVDIGAVILEIATHICNLNKLLLRIKLSDEEIVIDDESDSDDEWDDLDDESSDVTIKVLSVTESTINELLELVSRAKENLLENLTRHMSGAFISFMSYLFRFFGKIGKLTPDLFNISIKDAYLTKRRTGFQFTGTHTSVTYDTYDAEAYSQSTTTTYNICDKLVKCHIIIPTLLTVADGTNVQEFFSGDGRYTNLVALADRLCGGTGIPIRCPNGYGTLPALMEIFVNSLTLTVSELFRIMSTWVDNVSLYQTRVIDAKDGTERIVNKYSRIIVPRFWFKFSNKPKPAAKKTRRG